MPAAAREARAEKGKAVTEAAAVAREATVMVKVGAARESAAVTREAAAAKGRAVARAEAVAAESAMWDLHGTVQLARSWLAAG